MSPKFYGSSSACYINPMGCPKSFECGLPIESFGYDNQIKPRSGTPLPG